LRSSTRSSLPGPVAVMVHRGEAQQAPENSRPALTRCIDDYLEWAKVDVRRTRDGQHVLVHDEQLQAGDGTRLRVADHSLEELKQIDVGLRFSKRFSGEHVLLLAEGFALAKGKLNLCLDCKEIEPAQLAREIVEAGMEQQVLVYDRLQRLKLVWEAAPGKIALMAKWKSEEGPAEWALSNSLAAVEIDADAVTPEICRKFHKLGMKVEIRSLGAWDTREYWARAMAAKADLIQTDLPEEVVADLVWQRVTNRPALISLHRGANRYAPENTLPAFEKAIRLGTDYIEFDVRTTSDGKLFLLHDSTLDGRTDGHGPIASTPSSVIATLSAGSSFGPAYANIGLPTLDAFLGSVAGRVNLYFDAKQIEPEVLNAALLKYDVVDKTVVYGSPFFLAKVKAANPKIRLLAPLGSPSQIGALAESLKPYAFDTNWKILSRELIQRCHSLNIKVFSDALGDHERVADYVQAIEWGIDLIQTDHPLRVMRAMEIWAESNHAVAPAAKPQR